MGIGDDLISSGIARVAQETDPRKVRPMLERGFRFSDVWLHNPRITQPDEKGDFNEVMVRVNHLRPYMAEKQRLRWIWKEYRPPPGEIYFSEDERAFGLRYGGRVILEPHNKPGASPNKEWGYVRWSKLCWLLQEKYGLRVTQLGPPGTQLLDGHVEFIETSTFRLAAAVIANARGVVVPEGGLHHCAAAVRVPAVVIRGGFIGPDVTGYDGQIDFFDSGLGCGMRVPCAHCREAMGKIKPEAVAERLLEVLSAGNTQDKTSHRLVAAG